ncbi:MAG TPA: 16S rRNA (guanine(527)-N(7))-methyltransferase RsmG [Candidatus Kapabacteria bacterium]|jgi:16S rRNA (guanine527-N7)-methyltransferase|nr:16S rRNA (guanine(527)-N(7))-methyltransferase RsmG [Candidatus Kapabacteria bacterium]
MANGLELSGDRASILFRYCELLRSWNARINLISRKDEENILARHILHSLVLRMPAICDYDFTDKRVADIGTGGGLPGIPIRIVTPSISMTLIDSVQKKIAACQDMIGQLGLSDTQAVAGRAEELAKLPEFAGGFDAIVSRAVAPLEELIKWTQGLLKPSGMLFSLKGGDLNEEIKRANRLSYVASVEEIPLALNGYDEFSREGKKLVRVQLKR